EKISGDLLLNGLRFNFSQQYPAYLIKNRNNLKDLATASGETKQTRIIEQLIRDYDILLNEIISSLIEQRRKFITSYLNQSRFGLARHYDSTQVVQ
ncbi:MAG: hypothetical protein OEY09_20950, partial [Gammaproteobacteria bacterium]|nr:hypothetical protein [Gammaproteobacteria bacterium]